MTSGKQPHILNASSNLLGICFILVTGLKLTRQDIGTFADEFAIFAAMLLMASCFLSYLSMSVRKETVLLEMIADRLFLLAMLVLFFAIVIFSTGLL